MDRFSFLDSFRWIRTSRKATLDAQQRLLELGGVAERVVPLDTSIEWSWRGRRSTEIIHSLEGGSDDAPPLVYWPGYGESLISLSLSLSLSLSTASAHRAPCLSHSRYALRSFARRRLGFRLPFFKTMGAELQSLLRRFSGYGKS